MTSPQKYAELIKAWADGAQIQVKYETSPEWKDITYPKWVGNLEYRLKPEPKADIVKLIFLRVEPDTEVLRSDNNLINNLRLTFDYETGQLKSAEMI
jgi:hypothetical protein